MRQYALSLAGFGLLSIRVACIGNHVDRRRPARRGLRGFRHRMQAAVVAGLNGHLLHHDQRVFGIDGGLHVVGRKEALSGAHEGNFWLRVPVQLLQRTGHSTGVDDHLVLLIALLQLLQVAFQCLTLAHTFHAADSLELRAIDGDPLTLH